MEPQNRDGRGRKRIFPRMSHFPAASPLHYCSHSWNHWLTTGQRFLFSNWVKFFSARKSPWTDWPPSPPLGWIWVEILICGYIIIIPPFFSFTVLFGDTWAFGASKKRKLRRLYKSSDDWHRHLVLQPTKTITIRKPYLQTRQRPSSSFSFRWSHYDLWPPGKFKAIPSRSC